MPSAELNHPDPNDPPEAPPTFQDDWWEEVATGGVTVTNEELEKALEQQ